MQAKHLRRWMVESREAEMETETPDASNWRNVMELVQTELWDVLLADQATWQAVVLIPKGGGNF